MSGENFPAELRTLERALAGESSIETVLTAGRAIHSIAAPIFLNGKILGGVGVNTDVTQIQLQEEGLRGPEELAAVGALAAWGAGEVNKRRDARSNLLVVVRH